MKKYIFKASSYVKFMSYQRMYDISIIGWLLPPAITLASKTHACMHKIDHTPKQISRIKLHSVNYHLAKLWDMLISPAHEE